MSFFSKLFSRGKQEDAIPPQGKISLMLDEERYWQIVAESLDKSNSQEGQEIYLVERLQKLSLADIVGFRLRTDKLLYDTYTSEMWCAGYIMNGGCSDDGFEYFRNWVISRGRDVYYAAKANPDTLISQVSDDMDFYDFEGFWYVALTAFEKVAGKNLYDFIDDDNFKFKEGHYPNFEFTWQEENPESMRVLCPQLFEKMWDN